MGRKRDRDVHDAAEVRQASKPSKKRRHLSEQDTRLVSIYENLASEVRDIHIQATKDLLHELFPTKTTDSGAIEKAISRLIRGLCSSRKAARFGFSVALTELLWQIYSDNIQSSSFPLSVSDVIDLLSEKTQPEGKTSGQERKDYYHGRIAGCKAIIQSGILAQDRLAIAEWPKVLDLILSLIHEKAWLREECGKVLYDAAAGLSGADAVSVGTLLLQTLKDKSLVKTPEGVAVWLAVQHKVPDLEFPANVWFNDDPLYKKNWRVLAEVLRTGSSSSKDAEGKQLKNQGGASQPTPKFAWHVTISAFVEKHEPDGGESDENVALKSFTAFWNELVDNNLFTSSASQERKSWGFQILSKAIAELPSWAIPVLFSPNLMKCLVNQRADADRYLHSASAAPLTDIKARVKKDPQLASVFLHLLLRTNGSVNFDQITKSKTIESIVSLQYASIPYDSVRVLIQLLMHPAADEVKAIESQRRVTVDLLLTVLRNHITHIDDWLMPPPWVRDLFKMISNMAYLSPIDRTAEDLVPVPPVTKATRDLLQNKLSTALNVVLSSNSDNEGRCPELVVSHVWSRVAQNQDAKLAVEVDKKVFKRLGAAHNALQDLASRVDSDRQTALRRALRMLYCLTLIQAYAGEPDALSILDDLEAYKESMSSGAKQSVHVHSTGAVIEVLLSFVSRPSQLFRKLVEQVFAAIAPELKSESLEALIDVLQKPETLTGQNELFQNEDEEAEGGEDDESNESEDESLDSDVELFDGDEEVNGIDDPDQQDSDDEDDSQRDSDGESEADENEEELQKLDAVLAETLGTMNNTGDSSDTDADMDDDEMMALEPHLTEIFKQRRKASTKKQDRKDAKQTMINFKNRVLDLLQIYVKKEHANPPALTLIMPLLRLMRETSDGQVATHAFNVLKIYFESCKGKELPRPDDPEELLTTMTEIHGAAVQHGMKENGNAYSRSSLFLAKVLVAMDKAYFTKISEIYRTTLEQWYLAKKPKIQSSFFSEWTSWCISTKQ